MPNIDIPLPEEVTKALETPRCEDFGLPKPNIPELHLPTGGTVKGIADITKGIPDDCSMNVSLALQIAPIMASMECLLKVLDFLGTLIESFSKLSDPKTFNPADIPLSLHEIVEKGEDLMKTCIAMIGGLGIPLFIKDLLLMIIKMLKCMVQALKSVVEVLDGLELEIASAAQNGNDALAAQLECARENAMTTADSTMQAIDPIATLLALAQPFMGLMPGAPTIQLPQLASDGSIDSLKEVIITLEQLVLTLEGIVEAI